MMNRRDFLAMVGAFAATAAVPNLAAEALLGAPSDPNRALAPFTQFRWDLPNGAVIRASGSESLGEEFVVTYQEHAGADEVELNGINIEKTIGRGLAPNTHIRLTSDGGLSIDILDAVGTEPFGVMSVVAGD